MTDGTMIAKDNDDHSRGHQKSAFALGCQYPPLVTHASMILERPQQARGISCIHARLVDRFRHHRARSDHDTVADVDREDRRVAPDRYLVADSRRAPQLPAALGRPAGLEQVVDEHHPVRDEAVLEYSEQIAEE